MKNFATRAFLLVLFIIAGSCTSQSLDLTRLSSAALNAAQAFTLTDSQLKSYVSAAVAQMDAQNQVAPASSQYTKRLNNLTKGLAKVKNTPLNFKVYVTKEINAFACADGSVRVYTGIMDLMTDDELLGIIGHEVGHVALEHSKKAIKQELLNNALFDVLASTSRTAAVLTDSQLGAIANTFMSAKFSQKQEKQADEYGYKFIRDSGKNPYAMVKAFEKMQQLEGKSNSASKFFNRMFGSHPETQDRIKAIKKMCAKDGFTEK